MATLTVALLGQFECLLAGNRPVKFRTSRAQALLAFLATEYALGTSHQSRETIRELFWPGMPPESSRTNLRQNLYYLRQGVSSANASHNRNAVPFLLSDRQTIALNADYPLDTDVQRFTKLLNEPKKNWTDAIDLYRVLGRLLST